MTNRSWDLAVSLDTVLLGPIVGTEEAASSGVQKAAKVMAARFQLLSEDSYGSRTSFYF
jgi:hypothetical protein